MYKNVGRGYDPADALQVSEMYAGSRKPQIQPLTKLRSNRHLTGGVITPPYRDYLHFSFN
jgi:hypothetical protein